MKILIVEDDIELRNELKLLLYDNGYEAMILPSFYNAKEKILAVDPDLVLLDIKIPNTNGQQLLKEIRKESDVPVIMVTSKDSELDEVLSMSYGADDYITKPYNPALLLLHIEALFRRMNKINNTESYRGVKVNLLKSTLENGDKELLLSKNEMSIFYFLLNHQGEIVTRNQIMNHLWGEDKFIDDNTLTVNITRLRKKLESIELKGVIETRREQGYILI
ncbi:response regulator transcription factor [Clostridium sp. UBA7339]|uniref:response regulator transcription factor n=1 Tax=Clostridium sp. UBA7339 TaxID=1946376 RepID=UPI0032163FA4